MGIDQNIRVHGSDESALLHSYTMENFDMITISRQLVITEDGYSIVVEEQVWNFATLLASISIPDRKVSQIKLLRTAFPDKSLRDYKMIVEAAMGHCEVF